MEIKPQELRIGNLVDRNGIMEVLGIGANNKLVIYDHYNKERLPYGLDVESFKGIDLTPEWLEKFGFKKEGEGKYAIYHAGVALFGYWTVDGAVNVGQFIPRDIKHVHQLQNLYFALTGEELAIDNKSL